MTVGKSWRTYAKHELMRSITGQEIGVANSTGNRMSAIDRLVFYDLTAGDGVAPDGVDWLKGCSPGILAHCAAKSAKPVLILLHEIQANTYGRLLDNLAGPFNLVQLGFERESDSVWRLDDRVEIRAIHGSGHAADVSFLSDRDAVLVFNDPNAITEWAMRDSFAQEIKDQGTWCCRMLSTMGCNPAGLKRLRLGQSLDENRVERIDWFGLIDAQQSACPGYRDMLLAAIERDDAQWAYLLSTSQNWRDTTEAVVRSAFKRVGRTAEMAWWRRAPALFEETKLRLFLTRKERDLLRGGEDEWLSLTVDERLVALTERRAA